MEVMSLRDSEVLAVLPPITMTEKRSSFIGDRFAETLQRVRILSESNYPHSVAPRFGSGRYRTRSELKPRRWPHKQGMQRPLNSVGLD